MGWLHRTNDLAVDHDSTVNAREFIQQLLQGGQIRTYGRIQLLAHLSSHYGFRRRGNHVCLAL